MRLVILHTKGYISVIKDKQQTVLRNVYNTKRFMVLILLLAKIKRFQVRNERTMEDLRRFDTERGGASKVKAQREAYLTARAGKLFSDF